MSIVNILFKNELPIFVLMTILSYCNSKFIICQNIRFGNTLTMTTKIKTSQKFLKQSYLLAKRYMSIWLFSFQKLTVLSGTPFVFEGSSVVEQTIVLVNVFSQIGHAIPSSSTCRWKNNCQVRKSIPNNEIKSLFEI